MKTNLFKISAAFLSILLAGCLDDNKYALDPSGSNNIIEFYDPSVPSNPSGAIYPVWTNVTEIQPAYEFEQVISFSGPNGNPNDIVLTLAIDPLALQEYNKQMVDELHGGIYEIMPDNYFSFDDFTVTIPKGQTKANISITVHPDQFDLTKNFALPLRIVSASSGILSAHFSVALLAVVVKNKYDGVYEIIEGNIFRNSAAGPDPVLGGDYDDGLTMDLETINGNTNGFAPLWKDGSGVGGVPATKLSVDEGTNEVTVTSGNASMKNTAGAINSYDPIEKIFTLNFDWGAAPNNRIISNLKLKYVGPRP
ncbi:DUF1735 domain-containing protein [Chryseotalea sanaruensis]|nr:DUF1735 domain-containing protein [Chryseotalea sanaruensis]